MAISVSFNGATIKKPGSYSKTQIDLGGNLPLSPTGLVVIIGEADAGAPVTAEIDASKNVFTPDQLSQARNKYRSGPIIDALGFLFAPSVDGAIPNGASAVWVMKTNSSTRASLALQDSFGTLRSKEWGTGGNRTSAKVVLSSEEEPMVQASSAPQHGVDINFTLSVNGSECTGVSILAASNTNLSSLVGALSAALPAFDISSSSGKLVIKLKPGLDLHRNGWGRSFELSDSNLPTDNLQKLGLSPSSQSVSNGSTGLLAVSSSEPSASIVVSQKRDLIVEEDVVGGNVVLQMGYFVPSASGPASVQITDTEILLQTPGYVDPISILKSDYPTLSKLVEAINLLNSGWVAKVSNALYNQLSPSCLDQISGVSGWCNDPSRLPVRVKKDAFEVAQMMSESAVVEILNQKSVGLPDSVSETMLSGGSKGATSSLSVVEALAKAEKFHCNFIVPLFSRDATEDIADSLTDAGSTYTIDGVHQAVKTHISLMKTVKKRSERQGLLSFKGSFESCKEKASIIADGRMQLAVQDVRQSDAQGNIKWFQPWALSCLLAGSRGGAAVGLPLTFKFLNCSGIRQTGQPMTTAEQDIVMDFDPDVDFEEAIDAGLTFLEAPRTGGFRVVVDNTTYGVDSNWVWNRANVVYAGDVVAYNFRNTMELRYVGVKNTLKVAEVKSTAESILSTFLAQGVTVSTPDAPQGFKDLSVSIEGNTIYISVTVKLVEGIDFILSEITLQRATQSA